MHTEIFKQIDLLIEMAGSSLDNDSMEGDLNALNKEIQDKKQRLEDLKSMMNDTRYFNASSELVDKNIEVSLKSRITRLNRKIREVELELKAVQSDSAKIAEEVSSLQEKLDENKKYVAILDSKAQSDQNEAFTSIVRHEKEENGRLESELEKRKKKQEEVLKEVELHEQALQELTEKKKTEQARLQEIEDHLNNPNAYINEDLKKQDEEELKSLNDSIEELQKKKLEYLTDPNTIGADAKEFIVNHNYTEALNKIKELLTIVKSKPYMDITNLSILDEELEKKENERTELSNYIENKNYAEMNSNAVTQRSAYLSDQMAREQEEIERYQASILAINQDIDGNLSHKIEELESEITKIKEEILEYQSLLQDQGKSRRTKANLENAILKKEKERDILEDILRHYKQDLLFQVTIFNAIHKIIAKYEQSIAEKKEEAEELEHLTLLNSTSIDYIEEEKDKDKLKAINEEIKQIKNRERFTKTPDEIYDQIEMLLANQNVSEKTVENKNDEDKNETIDAEIDDLFETEEEAPRIKVVDMIPAQPIQSNVEKGNTYGA